MLLTYYKTVRFINPLKHILYTGGINMKIQTTITIDKHKIKIPAKFPKGLIERRIMMIIKELAQEEGITVKDELEKIEDISLMIRQIDEDLYGIFVAIWLDDGYLIVKPLIKYSDDYTNIAAWMELLWFADVAKYKDLHKCQ